MDDYFDSTGDEAISLSADVIRVTQDSVKIFLFYCTEISANIEKLL